MGWLERVQLALLAAGLIISSVLLGRFAFDFSIGMSALLAAPFWLLVLAALAVAAANILGSIKAGRAGRVGNLTKSALLAAIPLSFLASSLDCMGLSWEGCSPFCTFVKLAWIPLMSAGCFAYFITGKRWLLAAITVMSFAPLAPHCVCYNVGNGWWIDRLGASPVCYAWGFVVSVISVSALVAGKHLRASLAVCGAIIAGATAFFVSHHYFHFPW